MSITLPIKALVLGLLAAAALACATTAPAPHAPTATSPMRIEREPTRPQLQPGNVNADCAGCDVAMPREVATPSLAMRNYNAPDKVLLVTCSRGYAVEDVFVMGATGRTGYSEIAVKGFPPEYADGTDCFAITAVYLGTEVYDVPTHHRGAMIVVLDRTRAS